MAGLDLRSNPRKRKYANDQENDPAVTVLTENRIYRLKTYN